MTCLKKNRIIAVSKFSKRVVNLPKHRFWAFFMPAPIRGSLTPWYGYNGYTKPFWSLDSGKWAAVFLAPSLNPKIMKRKNELQLVEIDHRKFAVEERNGNISFNLTQMAKPFGDHKKPSKWLRHTPAKDYLLELSKGLKSPLADLLEVRKGGTPEMAGTWANDYRIAIRFAQWLDVKFSIAVDELVYKILTKQAMVTEPFMGVTPLVIGHKAYYYYLDVLKALKLSTRSGSVAKRKRRFASQFKKCYNRNFVTLDFCQYLKQLSQVRQLEIEFKERAISKGGAL